MFVFRVVYASRELFSERERESVRETESEREAKEDELRLRYNIPQDMGAKNAIGI